MHTPMLAKNSEAAIIHAACMMFDE